LLLPIVSVHTPRPAGDFSDPDALKRRSLEELAQTEVTTSSKEPGRAFDPPSAATSIPETLRRAPGVELAGIDTNHSSSGIRGIGARLTRPAALVGIRRTGYAQLT
jgi:iron complex outermembrane receptor protein